MGRVAIIGCGVVGAAIAYELSHCSDLKVIVLDRGQPAQEATGAALGVLMGAISQKAKGRNLRMRLSSIQTYEKWVPTLEAITGQKIWYNRQGLLRLCFEHENLDYWRSLAIIRQKQGWELQLYDRAQLQREYPYLSLDHVTGAVYSPQDRQIDPIALTLALISTAQHQGVMAYFQTEVTGIQSSSPAGPYKILSADKQWEVDWVILAAGLGSAALTKALHQPVEIRPVLGQALQVKLNAPLKPAALEPVITGEDTHIVPIGENTYWIGATVEMPNPMTQKELTPDPVVLQTVWQRAIALCPTLRTATIQRTWSGLRPRPEGRPAPIIDRLTGYSKALVASGHYRNGILLAPATAAIVRQMIQEEL